jgi:hypothetical protein
MSRNKTQSILITWALGFLLLILMIPAKVQAQDFTYSTDDTGDITITEYTGSGGVVAIPDLINGLPVTSIGKEAFYNKPSVTSVTIPNSVTSIGSEAFYSCIKLTIVAIPNNVTSIGSMAFYNCTSLNTVTLGNSVASIGEGAFYGCTSLTSVTIPNSVTSLGSMPFYNCTSLAAITVDTLNSAFSSVDGVLFDKSQTTLIKYPNGKAGGYTIPMSVNSIGVSAFFGCRSLASITIPDSVTSIGNIAFYNCTSLNNVTLGNSVASIGEGAFNNCINLIGITIPSSVTSIGNQAFEHCTSLTGVYFQGNAPSLPNLGGSVFYNANNAIVYYFPGTTGWGSTFGGRPTKLWNPKVLTSAASFGVWMGRFGFPIIGTSGLIIVVEACTNLANPAWFPVATNTLTGGSSYFSDPNWTNSPARFYRLNWPGNN